MTFAIPSPAHMVRGPNRALYLARRPIPTIWTPAWAVLHEFTSGAGLPRSLAALGVTEENFETVSMAALLDQYRHTNPKPIRGIGDIMEILRMVA